MYREKEKKQTLHPIKIHGVVRPLEKKNLKCQLHKQEYYTLVKIGK